MFFHHYYDLEGVRIGRFKYLEQVNRYAWPIPLDSASVPNALGSNQLGTRWPLLYDLETDPGESYNVIDTYPEVAEELRGVMATWRESSERDPRGFRAE